MTDVDARVLQSILQDEKLSLDTEEDIRKLLERGTIKTTVKQSNNNNDSNEEPSSQYTSTVIKTLSDTTLWRKLSAKADDVIESIQIWVSNKVEQDLKVVAALGIFAWDRVVRDVARALPESRTILRKPLMLSNSSSYTVETPVPPTSARSVLEDMNRPADEIRSVTRTILDILSGQTTTDVGRGLRTAAPAGSSSVGERQRRAYRQRTTIQRQQQDVTRVAGDVMDTVWELKQELKAESSQPGYKTQAIRTAIEAGVSQTGNILRAAKQQRQLQASKQAFARLQAAQVSIEETLGNMLEEMNSEREQIYNRMRSCIDAPERTWLTETVMMQAAASTSSSSQSAPSDSRPVFDGEGLQQIVTRMIFVRDEMEARESSDITTFDERMEDLILVRNEIDQIRARATEAVSLTIAEALRNSLLGIRMEDDKEKEEEEVAPLILRLEELQDNFDRLQSTRDQVNQESVGLETAVTELEQSVLELQASSANDVDEQLNGAWYDSESNVYDGNDGVILDPPYTGLVTPEIVDVLPTRDSMATPLYTFEFDGDDQSPSSSRTSFAAEIVSDDDFDAAFGQAKTTKAVISDGNDEDDEEQAANPMAELTLRALDVVFFVLEKTFTVVIPSALRIGQTVTMRIQEMQKTNAGSAGWETVKSVVDAKGRY